MSQTLILGEDEFTIEEVDHSQYFTLFAVEKNSEPWTYLSVGVSRSVLILWRRNGSPTQAADFLREAVRYVVQLGIQNEEIKGDIKRLKEGAPVLRYVFIPADSSAPVAKERTYCHDAESTPDLTVRRIKWLAEVNSYRLEHKSTLSL